MAKDFKVGDLVKYDNGKHREVFKVVYVDEYHLYSTSRNIPSFSKKYCDLVFEPKDVFIYEGREYRLYQNKNGYISYINNDEDLILLVKSGKVVFSVYADCGQNSGFIKDAKII